jgi:hypothetical protein
MALELLKFKVPAVVVLAVVMAAAKALVTLVAAVNKFTLALLASMEEAICVMVLATCSATFCVARATDFSAVVVVVLESTAKGS